jgi:hypothetical protein
MFKKTVIFSLAVTLMLMGLCSVASAAQNVANTSQKGSLLIWPGITTSDGFDTIIMLANDNSVGTTIKCYWMNDWQEVWDFEFPITGNQPVWFKASDGSGGPASNSINAFGDDQVGELKCFAISFPAADGALEQQVAWNHLYGSAIVFNASNGIAFEYPAWAFTARGNVATGAAVGAPGTMLLTGGGAGTYDACPAYLIYNFFAEDGNVTKVTPGTYFDDSYLALSPCYQDLRQDRLPTCTKAKFDIWNENERKLTGTYHCVKCWFEGDLDDFGKMWGEPILRWGDFGFPFAQAPDKKNDPKTWTKSNHPKLAGFGGENFEYLSALHTAMGRFRVTGISGASVCAGVYLTIDPISGSLVDLCPASKQVAVPFIGLKTTLMRFGETAGVGAVVANTGSTAGAWVPPAAGPTPTILWDASEGPQQVQGR